MLSPSNGGKPVQMALTFTQPIDVRTNNADVLKICGAMAEYLQVPYERVQDELGGYFDNPSPLLGARRLEGEEETEEVTEEEEAPVEPTKYVLNLFV